MWLIALVGFMINFPGAHPNLINSFKHIESSILVSRPNLLRQIIGTRTIRLVDAIIADNVHTWNGLKEATDFSEKELNFHLSQLYSLNILIRKNREYYLIPEAVESYHTIDWRKVEPRRVQRKDVVGGLDYQLPSSNPKEAGARRKKLRGE
jgi:hypothetical protein